MYDYSREPQVKMALFDDSVYGRVKKAFAGWCEQVSSRLAYQVKQLTGVKWQVDMGDAMANQISFALLMKTEEWDRLNFWFQWDVSGGKVVIKAEFEGGKSRERKVVKIQVDDTAHYDRAAGEILKEIADLPLPKV